MKLSRSPTAQNPVVVQVDQVIPTLVAVLPHLDRCPEVFPSRLVDRHFETVSHLHFSNVVAIPAHAPSSGDSDVLLDDDHFGSPFCMLSNSYYGYKRGASVTFTPSRLRILAYYLGKVTRLFNKISAVTFVTFFGSKCPYRGEDILTHRACLRYTGYRSHNNNNESNIYIYNKGLTKVFCRNLGRNLGRNLSKLVTPIVQRSGVTP